MSKELEKKQKNIYVLLTGTNTIVAKLIRLYTREPYSHASIALDEELYELYSFARKQRFNPLNSGFIKEDINKGVFGADKNTKCGVYKVPVTETQYEDIAGIIRHFDLNKKGYGYNFVGLFSAAFGINVVNERRFLCSQFVDYVFSKGGVPLFNEKDGIVRPYDFHIELESNQLYKGKLSEYREWLKTCIYKDGLLEKDEYPEAI